MIHKNPIDRAEYECHVMANGMRALTVSDPALDKCSCGVSVRIGSFDEPSSTAGLAHFLEHMLFMGTEKYPKENEFTEFINQNSGSTNAVTMDEVTTYFFDVMPEAFGDAVDMFADFFRSPLFLKGSVDREISAVNSEFLNGLNRDEWRNYRMMQVFSRKSHPASRFTVGNYGSLRKEGIWEEVQEFWRTKYSSELMCVVIYGNESSSRLKEYLKAFEEVPRCRSLRKDAGGAVEGGLEKMQLCDADPLRSESGLRPKEDHMIFEGEFLNRWIRVLPVVDKKRLIVSTIVPSGYNVFRNNPYLYVSNIFHRKDERGLIHRLKNKGLAFSCSLDMDNTTGYSIVTMTMLLSEKGSQDPHGVIRELAEYLCGICADEREYRMVREISGCLFEYAEKLDPSDQCEMLAERMQFYPVENILNFEYMFEEFREEEIKDFVSRISDFRRWLVVYNTKEHEFDMEEEIYGIRYSVGEKIFETMEDRSPGVVPYVVEDGEAWVSTENVRLLSGSGCNAVPNVFREEEFENGKVTYLFDESYRVPNASVNYLFRLDGVTEDFVNFLFLVRCAEDTVCRKYDSFLYRMQVSISSCVRYYGVEIRFEGFSYGIRRVAELFFDVLFGTMDPSRHEIIREEIRDELVDEKNLHPFRLLRGGLMSLKIPGHLTAEERMEKLGRVSLGFAMPERFLVEVFAVGNITYEEVMEMFRFISSKQREVVTYGGIKVMEDARRFDIKTADSRNNACGLYYHSGSYGSYRDIALTRIIVQSCQEMFFDNLRTKEELGYVVLTGVEYLAGSQYISFVVQSERDTGFLEKRIQSFVGGLHRYFEDMSGEDFMAFKRAVVSSLREKHKNLSSYSSGLWFKYTMGVVDTNYEDNVISVVNTITKEDIMNSEILCSPHIVKASAN